MELIHFINHADKVAGGAQKIVHAIHDRAEDSAIVGFDYCYSNEGYTKTNFIFTILKFIYICLFKRNTTVVLHHRLYLLLALVFRPKRAFFVCHNIFPNKNLIFKYISNIHIIAISDEVLNYLRKYNKNINITVIYNGIEFDASHSKVDLASDDFNVFFIGRLAEQKGLDILISAFCKFNEKIEKGKLTIIGDGEDKEKIINQVKTNRNINLVGYVPKPFSASTKADVIVIPSRYEGFGLVFYEALEYNHFVIASDLPVFEKQPEDNRVVFFESENINELCECLHNVYLRINDQSMQTASTLKSRHRFQSEDDMCRNYMKLLDNPL